LDHRIIIQICECANPQQNFQRILAQEAATSANENRVNNKFPPDEPMVKHRAADEHMSERDNRNDGQAWLMTHFPIAMQVLCWQGMIQCHLMMMMIKMILFLMTCLDWKQWMMGQLTMGNHSRLLPLLDREMKAVLE
jgi:hypothetical protein